MGTTGKRKYVRVRPTRFRRYREVWYRGRWVSARWYKRYVGPLGLIRPKARKNPLKIDYDDPI